LADKLRTDVETLRALPTGTFATYVRGLPSGTLALKVPHVALAQLPRISPPEQHAIRDRMRAEYCFSPLAQSSEPEPSPATGNSPRSQARQVATRPDMPRPVAPRRDRPRQRPKDSPE